jgi:hypothetical protein
VEWHDGHRKGTGTVISPINDETNEQVYGDRTYYGSPNSFNIRDDSTGNKMIILARNLKKIETKKPTK